MTRTLTTLIPALFPVLALAACATEAPSHQSPAPVPQVDDDGAVARGPAILAADLTLDEVQAVAATVQADMAAVIALEEALSHDPDALVAQVLAIEEARLAELGWALDDTLFDAPTEGDLAAFQAERDLVPLAGGPRIDEDMLTLDDVDLDTLPADAPPWTQFGWRTWGSSTVTWCFEEDEDGTADLHDADVMFGMSFATAQWGGNSNLYFERTTCSSANIRIGFHTGYHWDWDWFGDSSSFDGMGGTLAHAFEPTYGYLHLDDAETWTRATRTDLAQPVDLDGVLTHEVGHTLGLGHSTTDSTATMWANYTGSAMRTLSADDITGIQSLYSGRTSNCTHTWLQAYYAKSQAYTIYSHVYSDYVAGDASYGAWVDAYYAYAYASYAYDYALNALYGDTYYGTWAGWALDLSSDYLEDIGIESFDYAASDNFGDDNVTRSLKAHYYAQATVITGAACSAGL